MMEICLTVVLCVLIVCVSICYCNRPNLTTTKISDLERVLLHMNQSISEIKENTYYINRILEQFKAYLIDEDRKS